MLSIFSGLSLLYSQEALAYDHSVTATTMFFFTLIIAFILSLKIKYLIFSNKILKKLILQMQFVEMGILILFAVILFEFSRMKFLIFAFPVCTLLPNLYLIRKSNSVTKHFSGNLWNIGISMLLSLIFLVCVFAITILSTILYSIIIGEFKLQVIQ